MLDWTISKNQNISCHLEINKDKGIGFLKRKNIKYFVKFYINNEEIEIVKYYKYLGVIFARSGSFAARKYLQEQAIKAMYSIIKKCRFNNLSIECQLDMFNKAVVPILLYGSEVWGFENLQNYTRDLVSICYD